MTVRRSAGALCAITAGVVLGSTAVTGAAGPAPAGPSPAGAAAAARAAHGGATGAGAARAGAAPAAATRAVAGPAPGTDRTVRPAIASRLVAPGTAPAGVPAGRPVPVPAGSAAAPARTVPAGGTGPGTPAGPAPVAVPAAVTAPAPAGGGAAPVVAAAGAPAPAPATTPTALAGPARPPSTIAGLTGVVPVEAFGAVGDGVTDDTAALQRAFDAAVPGRPVLLSPGHTYVHTAVLHLRVAGMTVTGAGTLLATREATSSVWIEADDVTLDGATLAVASTTRRWDAWEQMGLRLNGHSGAVVRSVSIVGSAAAGLYVGNAATGFLLDRVHVTDTRADGIHMTMGASNGTVLSPVVTRSGDDGVAVVSYQPDGAPCHDIAVVSPTVLGTTWGRGLSVVGGQRVSYTDIDVEATSAAAVYVAAEGNPYWTTAPTDVTVAGGVIRGANVTPTIDHGAVLVMSGRTDIAPTRVTVSDLTVVDTRATASRSLGVVSYGMAPTGIAFSHVTVTGGPTSAFGTNAPGTFTLTGVTRNGVPVTH